MIKKKTIKCPVCKKENASSVDFCEHCRYPLNIKKISELNKKDLSVSLLSLREVIKKEKKPLFANKNLEQIYNELLGANWLRPETALFRFIEAEILLKLKSRYLKYPILDLGCGDGLFAAILFGAQINKNYDAYWPIDFNQKDIYNNYAKPPKDFWEIKPQKIGFALDIKENVARRTSELKVYDEVKGGDARSLPFSNQSVNSIFSNMIDDIKTKDLSLVFKEAGRVLKKNGYFVFTSPTERFKDFLFYCNKAEKFKKQGKMDQYFHFRELDRGRSSWEGRALSFWKRFLKENSFELVEHIEYGKINMLQFWDTGFRPFFYYLFPIRNTLIKNGLYLPVKNIFLEMFREYLSKYAKGQIAKKGAFSIIVAKKNNEKRK